jgi:hypothetical protein
MRKRTSVGAGPHATVLSTGDPVTAIRPVFEALREHLASEAAQLGCFGRYEFQSEGWLKAEWIGVLDRLRARGSVLGFDREIKRPGAKKMIDLAVDMPGNRHWIELKHWCVGSQRGQTWRPRDFIFDLEREFGKFCAVPPTDPCWIAVLCTPNPGPELWADALDSFNIENRPWSLTTSDQPRDYPAAYFLAVLRADGFASPAERA